MHLQVPESEQSHLLNTGTISKELLLTSINYYVSYKKPKTLNSVSPETELTVVKAFAADITQTQTFESLPPAIYTPSELISEELKANSLSFPLEESKQLLEFAYS